MIIDSESGHQEAELCHTLVSPSLRGEDSIRKAFHQLQAFHALSRVRVGLIFAYSTYGPEVSISQSNLQLKTPSYM